VRASVQIGPFLVKNGPIFFGTFVFGSKIGWQPFAQQRDGFLGTPLNKKKKLCFSRLNGYKRGAGFGKCTKSVPFWDRFAFF